MPNFVSETVTCGSYAFLILISNFQIATLPPELWHQCMRWATLPPSGRLPIDDSLTMLDPWPVGMPPMPCHYLAPETAYSFEQSRLYPTKRALMLVSKAWAEIAVEFMYESIVIGDFRVGRAEQVFVALEGSAGFKQWVKRVDIFRSKDACERLARIGLPNLRVQNMFFNSNTKPELPTIILSEQPLHLEGPCGSPIIDRLSSRDETFGSLRCLTLWMVKPLPTPFHLPSNLRRLTIVALEADFFRDQDIFSTRDSIVLPNLTHLVVHDRYHSPDWSTRFTEIIKHFGPQLRHLTLSVVKRAQQWTGFDLCTILSVCAQLTELVIPSHLGIWETEFDNYGHSALQTLGIPIMSGTSEWDCKPSFDIFSRRESFPKLATIRLVSWGPEFGVYRWLEPYSLRLRDNGIRLENYWGRLIPPAPVPEDHN